MGRLLGLCHRLLLPCMSQPQHVVRPCCKMLLGRPALLRMAAARSTLLHTADLLDMPTENSQAAARRQGLQLWHLLLQQTFSAAAAAATTQAESHNAAQHQLALHTFSPVKLSMALHTTP